MVGIILLVILVPLIIIILLVGIYNRTSSQQQTLDSLYEKIKQLSDRVLELSKNSIEKERQAVNETKGPVKKEEVPPVAKEILQPSPQPVIRQQEKPVRVPESKKIEKEVEELAAIEELQKFDNKKEKTNNDWEKFIGENLANKIGIAVLVLGIAFFVKYAIDKNWVREGNRVIIGLVCGCILIGLAHKIRNQYRAFSSVLAGGGLAVFYFSIAFAFHQYHLISQQSAFFIMVIITALGVVLSIFYDRLELSILATVGGFITPFLVSTGQDNYVALFTYLCILNAGLMVLAWFKRWPVINFIALFFTTITYGGWLLNKTIFSPDTLLPYKDALFFASLFYLQFVAMNVMHKLRLKRSFAALDFLVILSINFLFYAAGMVSLEEWGDGKYQGLFTAALCIFNLLLTLIFYRNKNIDRNFIYLLIGLTLSFASLFAPVQLHGNYITLFWAAEMVVLFWLYQRSGINLLKIASVIITGVMCFSLFIDWVQIYFSSHTAIPVIINKGFVTTVTAAVSLFIYFSLMRKEANSFYLNSITNKYVRDIYLTTSILVLYLAGVLEIAYQFKTRFDVPLFIIYLQLYSYIVALVLLKILNRAKNIAVLRILFTILCLALYLLNIRNNLNLAESIFENETLKPYFIAHWLGCLLLLKLVYDLVVVFRKNKEQWISYLASFTWLAAASIILILSAEAYQVTFWANNDSAENMRYAKNLFYKAGLTSLWSVCSFIMMWLGMKFHFRELRIISLTLFTGILIKLFAYDISNIPPGGKIAAFILLGVLLLIVSFMYQRLKKIIIDDADEKNKNLV